MKVKRTFHVTNTDVVVLGTTLTSRGGLSGAACFVAIWSDKSLYGPNPMSFAAATLNWYLLLGFKLKVNIRVSLCK